MARIPVRYLIAFVVCALLAGGSAVALAVSVTPSYQVCSIPTSGSHPQGVAKDSSGDVWFVETGAGKVGKVVPSSCAFTEIALPGTGSAPEDIALGPDGNMWVTDPGTNAIDMVPLSATSTAPINRYALPTSNAYPESITAGPDGALWFTERAAGKIGRIATAGTVTNEFSVSTVDPHPDLFGIAKGPDGNLWWTDFTNSVIGKLTTTGTPTAYPLSSGANPAGIVAGPDGNLWFTEYTADRIGQMTPAGKLTEFPVPTGGSNPSGITAGTDGNLYFTENAANKFGEITPSGTITEYTLPGSGNGPDYIADPGGKLAITGNDAGNVMIATVASCSYAASLSPATLTFSTHVLGRLTDPQTLTLTNTGTCTLDVTDDHGESSSTPGFFISSDTCNPATLAVGQSCTTNVRFSFARVGDDSGYVGYNDQAGRQSAQLSGAAKTFPGGPGGSGHVFSAATKEVLKGVDKSFNETGNVIGLAAGVNAVLPEPVVSKGFAVALGIVAAGLKVVGSGAGWIVEYIDPPSGAFAVVPTFAHDSFTPVHPGPGVSRALAAAVNAFATNALLLRANLHALSSALDRASGALRAGNSIALGAQYTAAARFASSAAAELRADPRLRERATAALGRVTFNLSSQVARAALRTLARKGPPARLSAIFRSLGLSTAQLRSLASHAPLRLVLSPAGAGKLLHNSIARGEQMAAATLTADATALAH